MNIRKFLLTSLLVIGILAASVLLFFAGDHDDPDQGGGPTPTLGHRIGALATHNYVRANARSSAFNFSM
jgi:hypothetical protein